MYFEKSGVALFFSIIVIAVFFCAHSYLAPLIGEEARYASVAWQMFIEHNWFIPKRGDAIYLDKTPLLYWLLDFAWWVRASWPWQVMLPATFAILVILFTQKLSKILFQDKPEVARYVPFVLLGMPFFVNNLGLLRFDMLLTLFNVLACCCLTRAHSSRWCYWGFVLANGLGLLAKGPVIYLFTIPEAILFCLYFSDQPVKSILKLLSGILISLVSLLVWWGPILYQGKSHLLYRLFFEQVLSRTTGARGPEKPFWDYVASLPCFFLPWLVFVPFFSVKNFFGEKENNRKAASFLLWVFIVCLILFSCIKTKEARYLLPIAPLVAIYITYRLQNIMQADTRLHYRKNISFIGFFLCLCAIGVLVFLNFFPQKLSIFYAAYFPSVALYICLAMGLLLMAGCFLSLKKQVILLIWSSICVVMTLDLSTTFAIAKTQDITPSVKFIDTLLLNHVPVVSRDNIASNMWFLGRWHAPIPVITSNKNFDIWVGSHPNAWVITTNDKSFKLAEAGMSDGCFKQSFMHLRKEIEICSLKNNSLNTVDKSASEAIV